MKLFCFLQASMAPSGVNPSVRVYRYSKSRRAVVDFRQHFLPLDRLPGAAAEVEEALGEAPSPGNLLAPAAAAALARSWRAGERGTSVFGTKDLSAGECGFDIRKIRPNPP